MLEKQEAIELLQWFKEDVKKHGWTGNWKNLLQAPANKNNNASACQKNKKR